MISPELLATQTHATPQECDRCGRDSELRHTVRFGSLVWNLCARCWYDSQIAYGLLLPPRLISG
jgi:hypothetical protein